MKKTNKLVILSAVMLVILINCQTISLSNVDASNPKIGIDINNDGYIVEEITILRPNTEVIYFQFNLESPENMEVALDFKWYYQNTIIAEYSGIYFQGPITATLRRDKETIDAFREGGYHVEVWFLNTLLIKDFFTVIN